MGINRRREEVIAHKYNAAEIELAVANYFGYRQNLIVPNVADGMGLHECDLLVVTPTGYATEVEIKISASDLKADAKKNHGHASDMIKLLYFAIPESLTPHIEHIPAQAGVMIIKRRLAFHYDYMSDKRICDGEKDYCEIIRGSHVNKIAQKWTAADRMALMRLSTMRIWSLKRKLRDVTAKGNKP